MRKWRLVFETACLLGDDVGQHSHVSPLFVSIDPVISGAFQVALRVKGGLFSEKNKSVCFRRWHEHALGNWRGNMYVEVNVLSSTT